MDFSKPLSLPYSVTIPNWFRITPSRTLFKECGLGVWKQGAMRGSHHWIPFAVHSFIFFFPFYNLRCSYFFICD